MLNSCTLCGELSKIFSHIEIKSLKFTHHTENQLTIINNTSGGEAKFIISNFYLSSLVVGFNSFPLLMDAIKFWKFWNGVLFNWA